QEQLLPHSCLLTEPCPPLAPHYTTFPTKPCLFSAKSDLVKRAVRCPNMHLIWSSFGRRCFYYVPKPMSWARAEKNCRSMRGSLASVHSLKEYHAIQSLIKYATHEDKEAWIGGTDAPQEGIWLWSDGTPFNYRHCGGFNNYKGQQHCLQMNYGADNCWDDVSCTIDRPFVCAKKP
uniref:C-type lectin domain-containing protein n=1 Tax=Monopterus albus TaxID=43700 RepID=A0A3Q3JRU6_MONAL